MKTKNIILAVAMMACGVSGCGYRIIKLTTLDQIRQMNQTIGYLKCVNGSRRDFTETKEHAVKSTDMEVVK